MRSQKVENKSQKYPNYCGHGLNGSSPMETSQLKELSFILVFLHEDLTCHNSFIHPLDKELKCPSPMGISQFEPLTSWNCEHCPTMGNDLCKYVNIHVNDINRSLLWTKETKCGINEGRKKHNVSVRLGGVPRHQIGEELHIFRITVSSSVTGPRVRSPSHVWSKQHLSLALPQFSWRKSACALF